MRARTAFAAIITALLLSACSGPADGWLRGDPNIPAVTPGVTDNGG